MLINDPYSELERGLFVGLSFHAVKRKISGHLVRCLYYPLLTK